MRQKTNLIAMIEGRGRGEKKIGVKKMMKLKDAMEYVKKMLYFFEQDLDIMWHTPSLFVISEAFEITKIEYPSFLSFEGAEQALKYKTVQKYLDEEITSLLKCPNCNETKDRKCWELVWGSGVEIVWYEPK